MEYRTACFRVNKSKIYSSSKVRYVPKATLNMKITALLVFKIHRYTYPYSTCVHRQEIIHKYVFAEFKAAAWRIFNETVSFLRLNEDLLSDAVVLSESPSINLTSRSLALIFVGRERSTPL
ncbi:hypothetical protein Trydic_g10541 [Trypoxylus dichotomus]